RRKNGDFYPQLLAVGVVRDAAGQALDDVALFSDITAIREHQKQLEHVTHHDVLTNLPNRTLLTDRLHQAIGYSQRRQRSLAVVYVDLDGYKLVNDRFGRDVGDELLTILAQRMKEELREGDTLARIGSDEFIAVLNDLDSTHDCEPVIARLLEVSAAPAIIGDREVHVSSSIGVTLFPHDGADADQLIRHADQAMSVAKQAGKNRYHLFDVEQDAAVRTLRATLDEIVRALEQHEFVLHFQPKVNMKTGRVIGAEALIRWQHHERGLLLPAAFLPIINDHPISVTLGDWVIKAALDQMVTWDREHFRLPISVNVGARQLQHGGFVRGLNEALRGRPPGISSRLEIEILESSALEDIAQISETMHACRRLGIHFAIDDFGTGYSSLTYLRRLPAEQLKIDQSFVRDMLVDPEDLAIVEGVIGLATAFRRQVIAEGVESIAHGEQLLKLGCELAQGYGIARPMPGDQLPGWVSAWRPAASWVGEFA
ncbi:MAG: EAL domain-containing protein, partial [Propionivibrio sp.]